MRGEDGEPVRDGSELKVALAGFESMRRHQSDPTLTPLSTRPCTASLPTRRNGTDKKKTIRKKSVDSILDKLLPPLSLLLVPPRRQQKIKCLK